MPKAGRRDSTARGDSRVEAIEPDAISLLRDLARTNREATADPTAPASPDLELLLVCDELATLRRAAEELRTAAHRAKLDLRNLAFGELKAAERRMRSPMLQIAKLEARTPAGIFAKAVAVAGATEQAAHLAKSLARDLLASPKLRMAIWPPAEG